MCESKERRVKVHRYAKLRLRQILLASAIFGALPAFSLAQTTTSAPASTPASTPGQAIPGTQGASSFSSSVPGKAVPGVIPISLAEAIDRGLRQNLGLLLSHADIRAARGQRWEQLSALLPHATLSPYANVSRVNLQEVGITLSFPGGTLPTAVGPFSYF